jgi:hypothetical protein
MDEYLPMVDTKLSHELKKKGVCMSCYRMLSLALGLPESLFTETFTAPGDENLFEGTTMCTSFVKSNM